jgi:acyl-CoA reductase-like NAD-dependent aldehyde dehydrogenase
MWTREPEVFMAEPQLDDQKTRFLSEMNRDYPMLIDGQPVVGDDTAVFRCVDPYEDATWGRIYAGDESHVDAAVSAARRAFEDSKWSRTTPTDRAHLLRSLADLIDRHADELTLSQIHENGKLIGEMSAGVAGLAMHARYVADLVEARTDLVVETGMPLMNTYVTHAPVGVVAAVTPWNSPLTLLGWKLLPALGAGCTLVVKPSEVTPTSTLRLAQLCLEAGFPAGVVNVVTGFGQPTAEYLVRHPGVDKIAFTGSTKTGQAVMRAAAEGLKRLTLELGGKSPQIVLRDADLDRTVHGVMSGIFAATGQTCLAGSRVLVEAPVYDEFVARLGAATSALALGDPLNPAVDVGPLASRKQLETVLDYLELGRQEGAGAVTGGRRASGSPELERGYFVEPTVFADVDTGARIAREEVFGPVVVVSRCASEEDAIAKANDTEFGLAAGVWTENPAAADRVTRAIRAGTVWVNTYRVLHYAMPFGGFKMSGYGRELGPDALAPYSEVKSVWLDQGNPQNFGRKPS